LAGFVQWEAGWFDQSLPRFLSTPPHDDPSQWVSMLHIDCDLYSSTRTVMDLLAPRLAPRPGKGADGGRQTVIVFDDLVNYPEYRQHEMRALWEFMLNQSIAVEVIAASSNLVTLDPTFEQTGQPAVVRLVRPGSRSRTIAGRRSTMTLRQRGVVAENFGALPLWSETTLKPSL
jgi:hypothetical protein